MVELQRLWNANMSLSRAYKWVQHKNLPYTKEHCIKFWRESYKTLGSHGSHTIVKKKHWSMPPDRGEIIMKYSVSTGMFGNYAEWCGRSISYYLRKAGYEPLSEAEQKHYRSY